LRELIKSSKKIDLKEMDIAMTGSKKQKREALNNFKTTPEALKAQISKSLLSLYENTCIMNKVEVEARYEIELGRIYQKSTDRRKNTWVIFQEIISSLQAVTYQITLIENVKGLKDIFGNEYTKYASEQINLIKDISGHMATIISTVDKMTEERKKANKIDHADKKAEAYCNKVKPYFDRNQVCM
jgi:glutamine synthetase